MKHQFFKQSKRNSFKKVLISMVTAAGCLSQAILSPTISQAAIIGADGGITLYVSYDNADTVAGASWDDMVTQVNSTSGASCSPTNSARSAQGVGNSPGSCPSGDTCLGREKLVGDIEQLAEYIYQSTEGAHYLRRVYLSDQGRSWNSADIRWSIGGGGSTAPSNGWETPGSAMNMRSTARRCIHDVAHHELGHYFYGLPDRYARGADGYYQGRIGGGAAFDVSVDVGDPNTVMSGNFPHLFVDTTNASLTLTYTPPGSSTVNSAVLTPALLADTDPGNDGPDRAHHGHTIPFAQDEWSFLPGQFADLSGVHTEGDFADPDMSAMPAVDIRFLGEDEPYPGTILLLDRSGSMGVLTDGIPAVQFVQEAGMYLYHSALPTDFIGTKRYNGSVTDLFDYEVYDSTNQLPLANFASASGLTNIAAALESAIDELIAQHGDAGVNGAKIVLMSDGKQTTGANLFDQVDRAVDKGIIINTLSFGNADTSTMNSIATATGGDVIEMSENTDGNELKMTMTRELSEMRGQTIVHNYQGQLNANSESRNKGVFEGTFNLSPGNRNLQFYLFLENYNAYYLDIELEDPAGNLFKATPGNIEEKGRLNGLRVDAPNPGKWTYRIKGSKRGRNFLPTHAPAEIIAYAGNPNLNTQLSVVPAGAKYPGSFRITSSLDYRYPLTNLDVIADIYRSGQLLSSVKLMDDGKTGSDSQAKDGIHTGLFKPGKFIDDRADKLRVVVNFSANSKTVPAPQAHYETGTQIKRLVKEFHGLTKRLPFEAVASDLIDFNPDSQHDPRLDNLNPRSGDILQPGDRGKFSVDVVNTYVNKQSLRASLGQGIDLQLVGIKPFSKQLGARLYFEYSVDEYVQFGRRDLKVQLNSLDLAAAGYLAVGDEADLDVKDPQGGLDVKTIDPNLNLKVQPRLDRSGLKPISGHTHVKGFSSRDKTGLTHGHFHPHD